MKVGIIGAGTMGSGIAQAFAQTEGYEVMLCDINETFAANGKKKIAAGFEKRIAKGKMTQEEADKILNKITTGVKDICGDCDLVVEAAIENMEIKKQTFKELDAICKPSCIFATNTSSLSITEIGSAVEILEGSGINPAVYTFPTVKPIDRDVIEHCAENYDLIVTVEEHNIVGGFGSAVAEVISELRSHGRLIRIGLNDTYSSLVGNQKYLRSQFGLDAKGIADRILAEVGK